MIKIHPIKWKMKIDSKNICIMKIGYLFVFVLYDYLAGIFWKRSDVENLARSLVSHIISDENLF